MTCLQAQKFTLIVINSNVDMKPLEHQTYCGHHMCLMATFSDIQITEESEMLRYRAEVLCCDDPRYKNVKHYH